MICEADNVSVSEEEAEAAIIPLAHFVTVHILLTLPNYSVIYTA